MYKITQQYPRGSETDLKHFKTLALAKSEVLLRLEKDLAINIPVFYRIYEGMDLIEAFDPEQPQHWQHLIKSTENKKEESESSGMGSGRSASPTPFSTAPRPKGHHGATKKDDEPKDKSS